MMKSQFNFHGIKAGVSATQVEDLVDLLTDANDTILERINMNLGKHGAILFFYLLYNVCTYN